MSEEHLSNKNISNETYLYVDWLITFMQSKCIDTDTRKVLRDERTRIEILKYL